MTRPRECANGSTRESQRASAKMWLIALARSGDESYAPPPTPQRSTSAVQNRRKRLLNAIHLRGRRHLGDQPPEVRVLHAAHDVLPAIRTQHEIAQRALLGLREVALAEAQEVRAVHRSLRLHDAIHRTDEIDEVRHAPILLLRRRLRMHAPPLQLIENNVMALLHPVIPEDVAEHRRHLRIGVDAALVMTLHEQLDVTGKRKH